MGKKSKKLNKTQEEDVTDSHTTNNNTDTATKLKKKNRKRDLNGTIVQDVSVQNKTEDISESDTLGNHTTMKTKKEKKKKHTKLYEEEICEEVQKDTDCNDLKEDQLDFPRKKKNKGTLLHEEYKQIETCVEIENNKSQKNSKEKKSRNSSLNESNIEKEKAPKIQDPKHKKNKGKKKAKTGAPVLNDEESQVTEEDIDRFIDELDEEDNKQYEDWVKLLDARLSKKQQTD